MLVSSLLGSCFRLALGDGVSATMMFSDSSSRVGQLSLGLLISSGAGLQKITPNIVRVLPQILIMFNI